MKNEPDIEAEDLEILSTLKSNPSMRALVKRLCEISRDEDPSCPLADRAEDAIDKAGQALKLESLRGWARSSSGNAEIERERKGGGKRSKKNR